MSPSRPARRRPTRRNPRRGAERAGVPGVFTAAPYGRMIVTWDWRNWPPVMERTLADDLKWALLMFTGAILGYLVFAGGDTSLLLGSFIGLVSVVVALNVVRRVRRGRRT